MIPSRGFEESTGGPEEPICGLEESTNGPVEPTRG